MLSNINRLITLFLAISILSFTNIATASDGIKNVAITQIVAHESLNKVRDGIVYELKQKYGDNINISLSNANGNIVTASQIASKITSSNPDLIIAIATPSAQTIVKASKNTNIPILFATVTDPIGAGLVTSLHKPGRNVSGTRNSSPLKEQLALALRLVPGLKNIGVVLNMSESNSVYMLEKLQEAARGFSIEVKYKAVANSADIKLATETLAGNVDAFFLLQDSTVASSLPSLIKSATKYKKPVISSYVEAVEIGALGGLAFDEYNIGIQTGKMALRVLEGASIGNMDVEDPEKIDLVINQKQAKELGIKIPEDIIKKANLR